MFACALKTALNDNDYEFAGMVMAYSIVHRGPLPTFLHGELYKAIANGPSDARPCIGDIQDPDLRQKLQDVCALLHNWRNALQ